MKRFKIVLILFILGGGLLAAQNKYERAYRIRKSQFPEKALNYISEKLEDARQIRFYKETDSAKTSFEAKFKKDRLWYTIEFDKDGVLESIGIIIKSVDIPDDYFAKIEAYLGNYFSKYRIRKLQQQYRITEEVAQETMIKNAFQNLMLPDMVYELFVKGKKDGTRADFEITFDAEGNLIHMRKALPANYDRVLY